MSSRKIIDDTKINWNRKSQDTLSYRMLFDDAPRKVSEPEEEAPDVEEILRETNAKWEEKLRQSRQEAFDAGVEQGFKQGFDEATSQLEDQASKLSEQLSKAHEEWQERQKMLDPGVLDLVFELTESVLEIPVENPAIRERLQTELEPLLQRMDESTKPVLWVSEADRKFVDKLKELNAPQTSLMIRVDKKLNAGEFRLETNRETVVHQFKTLLQDLKESLNLPSWKA